jgi:hypothetical protein
MRGVGLWRAAKSRKERSGNGEANATTSIRTRVGAAVVRNAVDGGVDAEDLLERL